VFLWLQLTKKAAIRHIFWCCLFTVAGCIQIAAIVAGFNGKGADMSLLIPIAIWLVALAGIICSVALNPVFARAPVWLGVVLRRIGLMTYPLYLLHQNAGLALIGQITKMGVHPYVALGSGISFALSASWGISVFLEPRVQKIMKSFLLALPGKSVLPAAST
jgi:peptidoglycan/LPS O-acetylase OafA/YrhL